MTLKEKLRKLKATIEYDNDEPGDLDMYLGVYINLDCTPTIFDANNLPEQLDFENSSIYEIDLATGRVVICAGGDWQEPHVFSATYDPSRDIFVYANDIIEESSYTGNCTPLSNANIEALLV